MTNATLALVLVATTLGQTRYAPRPTTSRPERSGGLVAAAELQRQQAEFKKLWGKEMVLKLDDLPESGDVPEFRVPYSGHDYPDHGGGTVAAMTKYDQAFNRGRRSAADYERSDLSAHREVKEPAPGRGFLGMRVRRPQTPGWYGHCNGWTAATIRHAEPQNSVTRNGVTFSPADIKGMLAELYMYSATSILDGTDSVVNPGTLHLVLGNWIGLGKHPIGMETAPGKVVINFPAYAYKSTIRKVSSQQVEVQTTLDYTLHIGQEVDKAPKNPRQIYFHYSLTLDREGRILGGSYFGDSGMVDMLWVPLLPVQGGEKTNERGNPYLDVKEVLSIWRDSVPADVRGKWFIVDAPKEDRVNLASADEKPAADTAEKTAATEPAAESPKENAAEAAAEKDSAKPAEKEKETEKAKPETDGAPAAADRPTTPPNDNP